MNDNDAIYVNASESAELVYIAFGTEQIDGLRYPMRNVSCPTLQEAVMAFYRLSDGEMQSAFIRTSSDITYKPDQIRKLYYGPKP